MYMPMYKPQITLVKPVSLLDKEHIELGELTEVDYAGGPVITTDNKFLGVIETLEGGKGSVLRSKSIVKALTLLVRG
jgi:hypothetical protein